MVKKKRNAGRPRKYFEPPKAFLVRLSPPLYKALQHYRIDNDISSLNDVVSKALKEWMEAQRRSGSRERNE